MNAKRVLLTLLAAGLSGSILGVPANPFGSEVLPDPYGKAPGTPELSGEAESSSNLFVPPVLTPGTASNSSGESSNTGDSSGNQTSSDNSKGGSSTTSGSNSTHSHHAVSPSAQSHQGEPQAGEGPPSDSSSGGASPSAQSHHKASTSSAPAHAASATHSASDTSTSTSKAPSKDPKKAPSKDPKKAPSKDPKKDPSKDPKKDPSKDPKKAIEKTGGVKADANPVKSGKVTSGIGFKKEAEENQDVIDTVDVKSGSGNWVFKNYWWRKIQELYGEIKEAFNRVLSSRMGFFSKRSEVDRELDRFYQHVGLEQGPLEDIINLALEVMAKEKSEQGFLNKRERAFLAKVKDKQHQLEQLKDDVKAIEQLDKKIDEALEVVLQQVDVCNKYEQEAWTTFTNVARELSDKEARKQYYDTKGLLQDINKVHEYLTGAFSSYFEQMIQGVQEHTQSIIAKMGALKNDQVDLKKEADYFEQEDEELEKEALEKKRAKEEKKKEASSGWFGGISDAFSSLVTKAQHSWDSLWGSKKVKSAKSRRIESAKASEKNHPTEEDSGKKDTAKGMLSSVEKEAQREVNSIEKDFSASEKNLEEFFGSAFDEAKQALSKAE